jgi:hypothetical protein
MVSSLHKTEIDYFDEKNPRSVINIVPNKIKLALRNANVQRLLEHDESKLRSIVNPTAVVNRLRMNFWYNYEQAQTRANPEIFYPDLFVGVCPRDTFEILLREPAAVAWILTPPTDYVTSMEEALEQGVSRIREILSFPLYKSNNLPDYKAAEIVLKTVALLDARVKGALTQRIEIQQQSLNYNINDERPKRDINDIKELDKQLMSIQQEVKQLNHASPQNVLDIDVTQMEAELLNNLEEEE